jgi:hypothetical protein
MNDKQPIRPSGWFYVLGAAVILAGMSVFVYSLFQGVFHLTDNLTQVVVPGGKDLTLQPERKYTIFLEEQSVVDGRIYSTTTNLNGLTCQVSSQTSGKQIDTHRARSSTSYNLGGRSGRSVLEFLTEEGGTYHLACDYEGDRQGPKAVLAVGSGVTEAMLRTILTCFVSIFGGGILGAAILVTVFLLRERAKRKMTPIPGVSFL